MLQTLTNPQEYSGPHYFMEDLTGDVYAALVADVPESTVLRFRRMIDVLANGNGRDQFYIVQLSYHNLKETGRQLDMAHITHSRYKSTRTRSCSAGFHSVSTSGSVRSTGKV